MNLKKLAVTAFILNSYLYTIAAEPTVGETAGSAVDATPTVEIDTVGADDYTELEDFVVVQQRKLVQSDGAKLTYNVSDDPEATSSNTLDILRKVPGVTVDAEENVRVNGQTSFKILMNGREDPMLKGDIKTVLKSLPAGSIKKIEVISEPGAKYEAEGVGGILNIITDKKQKLQGFMMQLSGWVNAYQAGGYVNGRTKVKNVMLDATVTYNNGRGWPRSQSQDRETEYLTDDESHLERMHRKIKGGWDYTGVNLNMSWEPDTLNLFTLSGYYGYNTWGGPREESRTMFRKDMTPIWSMTRHSNYDGLYHGVGTQASYQHTFGKEGHNIVASYQFDYWRNNNNEAYMLTSAEGLVNESPYSASRTRTGDTSHILQIDYANPFSEHHLLEAGAKMNLNNTGSNSKSLFGNSAADATVAEGQTVDMDQFKDIYALYASYTGTFSKWNAKAGVRYEHTDMGIRYHTGKYDDFTTRLDDVVPNAAVSYNFTQASSLRLAYQMRISRPGIWYVNPFVNDLTPGWITYGNPDLKSEKSHNVSLGYSNYDGKLSGGAKVTYRYTANGINDIIFVRDGVINSTYANVGKSQDVQFELNGDWSITDALKWSVFLSASYQHMEANSEMLKAKNWDWQYDVNTNVNYTMPCKVRLSAYGGFYTPWIDLQSRGSNGYYYGLGASRSFLKDDALTLTLNAGNFLPVSRKNKYTQSDDTVRLVNTNCYKQWNVGFSISWRFGGLKSSVKKTNANIEKEDSGNQGAGQGGGGK